ncbi:MAG: hypothetical protein LBN33_00110 [Desulfovibrio sp.]|nr:hypothetical protein [Desulfovibrio sp.]
MFLIVTGILGASLSFADETVDEKRYAPVQQQPQAEPAQQSPPRPGESPGPASPATPGIVPVLPVQPGGGGTSVVPANPDPKAPDIYVLPSLPGQSVPDRNATPGTTPLPSISPLLPEAPESPNTVIILPEKDATPPDPVRPRVVETPRVDVAPLSQNGTIPNKNSTILTPANFLPMTEEPKKKEPTPTKEPATAKAPPKESPPEKKAQTKKGETLRIPPDAAKTGSLEFLEGCWVGTRPEYSSKRIVTERFCFDKNGRGKRFIQDPGHAGECVGATKAVINSGGVLRMQSEEMACTRGNNWGASEMTCKGEGNQTPCSWIFKDIQGNPKQSYTIRFVRD